MASCAECKNEGKQICTVCSNYMGVPDRFEPKPKTRADKVRAMSDEDLAAFLSFACPPTGCRADEISCVECWLDWLREAIV